MRQGEGERPGQDVPAQQGHEREQHVRVEASKGVCWQCAFCKPCLCCLAHQLSGCSSRLVALRPKPEYCTRLMPHAV